MAQEVTTALLLKRDPNLSERWPSAQSSWAEQIETALADTRRDLRLRGFAWEQFVGFDEESSAAENYDGSNEELNDLVEVKALELVYRVCSRADPERWSRFAEKFENLYAAMLDRYAGVEPPGTFTTYDVDGSGEVDESEQAESKARPPIRL